MRYAGDAVRLRFTSTDDDSVFCLVESRSVRVRTVCSGLIFRFLVTGGLSVAVELFERRISTRGVDVSSPDRRTDEA